MSRFSLSHAYLVRFPFASVRVAMLPAASYVYEE